MHSFLVVGPTKGLLNQTSRLRWSQVVGRVDNEWARPAYSPGTRERAPKRVFYSAGHPTKGGCSLSVATKRQVDVSATTHRKHVKR